jgi:hypothetical protein
MDTTDIYSADTVLSQGLPTTTKDLIIPISFFRCTEDHGAKRTFWLEGSQTTKRETNAWVVTSPEEVDSRCDANVNFVHNAPDSWGRIVGALARFSQHAYETKESAPLFAPTCFAPVIRWNNMPQGINLTNAKNVQELIDGNRDFDPDIIVIDTLTQATPNIESNAKEMGDILGSNGAVGKIRKALNCLVVVLCHPPKSFNSRSDGYDISGHGSIIGNTDMILRVVYDKDTRIVAVRCMRNKDGPEDHEIWFKIPAEGIPVPEQIAKPEEASF